MQRTTALSRIEPMRFEAGPKSNPFTALAKRMPKIRTDRSRGVEAAQRPQLTPGLATYEHPSSRSGGCVTINDNWNRPHLVSEYRAFRLAGDQPKAESRGIKISIVSFTNCLGPVYHRGTIKRCVCISSSQLALSTQFGGFCARPVARSEQCTAGRNAARRRSKGTNCHNEL